MKYDWLNIGQNTNCQPISGLLVPKMDKLFPRIFTDDMINIDHSWEPQFAQPLHNLDVGRPYPEAKPDAK